MPFIPVAELPVATVALRERYWDKVTWTRGGTSDIAVSIYMR